MDVTSKALTEASPRTFEAFFPYYLAMHSHPMTRLFHFVGTVLQLPILLACFLIGWWWGLLAIPVVSYGLAWFSHFVFEQNRPATWTNPWYSLLGDYKMVGMMLRGQLWS
ncbi:MAG: Mpo1-like protein [Acidobacteriota bacterium]